jgi:hypothetical protein
LDLLTIQTAAEYRTKALVAGPVDGNGSAASALQALLAVVFGQALKPETRMEALMRVGP